MTSPAQRRTTRWHRLRYGLLLVLLSPLAYVVVSAAHTAVRDIFLPVPPIWALKEQTASLIALHPCKNVGRSRRVVARIQDGLRTRDVYLPCFPVRADDAVSGAATLRLLSEPDVPFYLRSGKVRHVFVNGEERYAEATASRSSLALGLSMLATVLLAIGWVVYKAALKSELATLASFREDFDSAFQKLQVAATVDTLAFSTVTATVLSDHEYMGRDHDYTRTVYARNHAGEYFKYRFDGRKGVLTHLPRGIAKLVLKDKFAE